MRWDFTLGDTQLRSMQAQGLSHHLMHRSLSQEEGERGWYMYVCVFVYVRDDCFYYHSWRNNVVIAFGTLSSFLVCDNQIYNCIRWHIS